MDVSGPAFSICFKSLLERITEVLGYLPSIYKKGIHSQETYFVVVLEASSPKAYYFQGAVERTLLRSQKDAALKAIRFLAKKHAIEIKDINFDQARMYDKCAVFYEKRARELENTLGMPQTPHQTAPSHVQSLLSVELDFLEVLMHVTRKLGIPMGNIDIMLSEPDLFQARIELQYPTGADASQYILSDNYSTAAEATRNVAKKAILQLQSDFKFTIRDVSFEPMVQAWLRCSAYQKTCIILQSKFASKETNDVPVNEPPLQQVRSSSPGPLGTITTPTAPPPLPPKKRKFHLESAPDMHLDTSSSMPREVAETLTSRC